MRVFRNNIEKTIFFKTLILGVVLNFSLYIYLPYVMDIFFNLNSHFTPILEANGRNLRIVLDNIVALIFKPFMVPYFSLLLSAIVYSYAFVLLYRYLNIEDENFRELFPYCIIFPCFTLLNPFYHDVTYYSINFLLSVVSFIVIVNFNKKYKYIIFLIINLYILFIYQLNFFFIISLLFFDIVRKVLEGESIKRVILCGIKYFTAVVATIVVYSVLLKILNVGMYMRDAGFNIFNLLKTYAAFLILPFKDYMQINELLVSKISILIIYLIILFLLLKVIKNDKYEKSVKLFLLFLIIIFPIAMNSVLLILKNPSRAMFAELYLIIVPYFLIKYSDLNVKENKIVNSVLFLSIIILVLSNFYTVNARYLELKNRNDAEKSWTIELVSTIKNTEGYSKDTKIVFLTQTEGNISGKNLFDFYEDYDYSRFGAEYASSLLRYNYGEGLDLALNYYGAFKYNKVSKEEMESILNNSDVKNMPLYPSYGSVKRIDNIIIVKFY